VKLHDSRGVNWTVAGFLGQQFIEPTDSGNGLRRITRGGRQSWLESRVSLELLFAAEHGCACLSHAV